MALCIPGNIYCICGFLCINKPSYRKLPAYRGVVRPFIGKWIRFSSIFPHLCRLIQHYQGTLFTFCQSDCRLAYKNNEFHGFRLHIMNEEEILEHKHYYNKKEILSLLKKNGFVDIHYKKFCFGVNSVATAIK